MLPRNPITPAKKLSFGLTIDVTPRDEAPIKKNAEFSAEEVQALRKQHSYKKSKAVSFYSPAQTTAAMLKRASTLPNLNNMKIE